MRLLPVQEQGYPWIVRKTIVKFGSVAATDIIWQSGPTLKVVSVNAKGAWQRKTVIGKEVCPVPGTGSLDRVADNADEDRVLGLET